MQPNSSSQHTAASSSSSSTVGDPSLYTGFTVQGGRIPNIPCDTGHFHYSSPCDPLSPPLETPQPSLPPPLIPMASGGDGGSTRTSSGGSTPRSSEKQPLKKEDTIDKVYNVLGDIVQTFDNLLQLDYLIQHFSRLIQVGLQIQIYSVIIAVVMVNIVLQAFGIMQVLSGRCHIQCNFFFNAGEEISELKHIKTLKTAKGKLPCIN